MPPETHALPHPPLGLTSSATEQVSALLSISGNAQINGGQYTMVNNNQYNVVNHNNVPPIEDTNTKIMDRLLERAAITALHNAGNLPDGGRCHPDTRTTILQELFQFIREDLRTRLKRILWLSGPAGSGKTTIARTLAYLCDQRNVDQASFFFCRLDMTRNDIRPLIATLAYQLACRYPSVASAIGRQLIQRPHIFEVSLQEQFRILVVEPLVTIGGSRPITCVIDALDECQSKSELSMPGRSSPYCSSAQDVQSDAVQSLYDLVDNKECPVVFIISSRPEANLRMAFNRIGNSISRIYLDSTYEPTKDILHFVTQRFADIKRTHPLAHLLPVDWPRQATINAIVIKSSGQFIYAATVMRYVSSPWSHPDTSLRAIMDSISPENSTLPFVELDTVFSLILSRTSNLPIVLDILACHRLSRDLENGWFSLFLETLGYSVKTIQPVLLDIASLVDIEPDQERIVMYNESLLDFLLDARRSGNFHIDLGRVSRDILCKVLSTPTEDNVPLMVDYLIALLPKTEQSTSGLDDQIMVVSDTTTKCFPEPFLTASGLHRLLDAFRSVYFISNHTQYKSLLHQWLRWWLPPAGRNIIIVITPEVNRLFSTFAQAIMEMEGGREIMREIENNRYAHPGTSRRGASRRGTSSCRSSLAPPARDTQPSVQFVELWTAYGLAEVICMSFEDIADHLGYDLATRRSILTASPLPGLIQYDSDSDTFIGPRPYRITTHQIITYEGLKTLATRVTITLFEHCADYSGNLFRNLASLLTYIKDTSYSDDLTNKISEFAERLCGPICQDVHPHVLDYVTFLDAVVRMFHNNPKLRPTYTNALLPHFVQFWALRCTTLDAQFLDIPQFAEGWIEISDQNKQKTSTSTRKRRANWSPEDTDDSSNKRTRSDCKTSANKAAENEEDAQNKIIGVGKDTDVKKGTARAFMKIEAILN